MKDAWLAVLRGLLADGKLGTAVATTLVTLVALVGVELTVDQALMVVSPLLVILSGQVIRDKIADKEEKKEVLHD